MLFDRHADRKQQAELFRSAVRLGIFGFYKSQDSDTKKYRKGCRKIES